MWTKFPIMTVREFIEFNRLEVEIKAPPTVTLDDVGNIISKGPEVVVAVMVDTQLCYDVHAEPGIPVGIGRTARGALKSLAIQLSGRTIMFNNRFIDVPHLC